MEKALHKRGLWFHLCDILKQAKLIYNEEKSKQSVWKLELTENGHEGIFYFLEGLDYIGLGFKTYGMVHFRLVYFIEYKPCLKTKNHKQILNSR